MRANIYNRCMMHIAFKHKNLFYYAVTWN